MAWNKPSSHFDGVDDFGNVFLVEEAGQLDLGEVGQVPIFVMFNSKWDRVSPYLGQGWELPLLETRMVQTDEKNFKLHQPGGRYRAFGRSKADPAILDGQGGWKAEIKGETINAYAPCGTKISLVKGKIVGMQIKDKRLEYVWNGNRVDEIREGGKTILKVETDAGSGAVTGLALADGKRIGIELGQRPLVEEVGGKRVVGGMGDALVKLAVAGGEAKDFKYEVDDAMNPTVRVNGERLIVWDVASRAALRDGEWVYALAPEEKNDAVMGLARTTSDGKKEAWSSDAKSGKKMRHLASGILVETERFASGPLQGKLRSENKVSADGSSRKRQISYDADGKIIRTREVVEKRERASDGIVTATSERKERLPVTIERKMNGNVVETISISSKSGKFLISLNAETQSVSVNVGEVTTP